MWRLPASLLACSSSLFPQRAGNLSASHSTLQLTSLARVQRSGDGGMQLGGSSAPALVPGTGGSASQLHFPLAPSGMTHAPAPGGAGAALSLEARERMDRITRMLARECAKKVCDPRCGMCCGAQGAAARMSHFLWVRHAALRCMSPSMPRGLRVCCALPRTRRPSPLWMTRAAS